MQWPMQPFQMPSFFAPVGGPPTPPTEEEKLARQIRIWLKFEPGMKLRRIARNSWIYGRAAKPLEIEEVLVQLIREGVVVMSNGGFRLVDAR
jgi:hypothetical protein